MKERMLPVTISALLLAGTNTSFADITESQYFQDVQQSTYDLIVQRLEEIKSLAEQGEGVTVENDQRFIEYRGTRYRLGAGNTIEFDLPKPVTDDSAIRNVFDFLGNDWALTWRQQGMVAINKVFGNENGCLIRYIPDAGLQAVTMEASACSVNSFETSQSYLRPDSVITAEDLGIENQHITAIERYGDLLYITQDMDYGFVTIFNTKTRQVVGRIDGITNELGYQRYNRVNDISIYNGYLYVATLKSLRVDIFDINNDHNLVLTLGSRNGSSSWPNALYRAQAAVANQKFVVAADASSRISVYRQQDLDPATNPDYGVRYGFLTYEGTYTNRQVQMHFLGDRYLMVSASDRANYFIYDMDKLEAAVQNGVDLAAEKRVDLRLQKVDVQGDLMTVSFSSHIEQHSVADFIANDFVFPAAQKTISALNGHPVSMLKDLHFDGKELITARDGEVVINTLEENAITFTADEQLDDTIIKLDALSACSVTAILGNDEPFEVITNRELRSVNVNSLVQTRLLDNNTVQITSYVAQEMRDITLELKMNGLEKWFVLGTIDRLPAFTQITLPLYYFSTDNRFNSANGDGVFDFNSVFNSDVDLGNLFVHRFSSKSDAFAQKISRLKPTWEIRFANKTTNDEWRSINGLYAREWLIMLTNLAYMVSGEEFRHAWFNFEKIYGYNMNSTAGPVHEPNGFFTPQDYQYYYDGMMQRPYVNAGVTQMGGGLGGATLTGVDTRLFYTHYYGAWGTIAHEFGHGFDGKATYGHDTSFANSSNGFHPMMQELGSYHVRKGDLPYMDENINGFYRDENSDYHYEAINHNRRKHRAANHMYTLEKYFLSFSDMPEGWFDNDGTFDPNTLIPNEQAAIAKIVVEGEARNACRFSFDGGKGETTLHGFVEKQDGGYRCTSGDKIKYVTAAGNKVTPVSPINEFQWLSLKNEAASGEPVTTFNGQPLCTVEHNDRYGLGYLSSDNSCEQQPEVLWENGNRWRFSSRWLSINYQ